MTVYNTKQEILDAIDVIYGQNRIQGVIEIDMFLPETWDMDAFNDHMTNQLVGEDYGFYLEDIDYRLVGCNTEKQTIFMEVDASADTLLYESDLQE
jgi:hypothetical protein